MTTINLDKLTPSELAALFFSEIDIATKAKVFRAGLRNCGEHFGVFLVMASEGKWQ